MKRTTLEDIGKVLGISKVAVHKALCGKDGISAGLKNKILATALEMGYSKCEKGVSYGLNFIYAVKKHYFLNCFEQLYSPLYYYLNKELAKTKSRLDIVFLEDKEEDSKEIIYGIINNPKTDGIFFAGEADRDMLKHLSGAKTPFLFIDYYSVLYNYNYLYIENYQLSYTITQYLISSGHKNIGFAGDISCSTVTADRYLGYQKALIENGITQCKDWHIDKNIERLSDIKGLLPKKPPTAYICNCDLAAYKLYTACGLCGLKIPDDVSVISFGNTALCESISPPLTSAGINKETMAKKACAAMYDIISDSSKQVNIV